VAIDYSLLVVSRWRAAAIDAVVVRLARLGS
jgi:hypothetical protein